MLEDGDLEVLRLLAAILEVIREIGVDLHDATAEHRIREALHQRNGPRRRPALPHDQAHARRQRAAEPREHHQALAALHAGVTGCDRDAVATDPFRRFAVDRNGLEIGQRKSEAYERYQVHDLADHEANAGHGVAPVLLLAARRRLLQDAILEVAGLTAFDLLLYRGEEEAV